VRLAFDTSVLVAAVLEPHAHHVRARPWTRAVASGEVDARISWHAAAETWAVLTRLPGALRLAPATATLVIERLLETFRPVGATGDHYRTALRRCTERGLRSGALFDALHLAVAEAERVDGLVTFNGADFERLRGERSPRILVPPDPPAFDA
jgi:predicted nucleic acid-binding protein